MADDAKAIGNDAELEDVAKMSIDIQLLDFRIRRSVGGHGSVGSLIRIVGFIKSLSFRICLKLPNDPMGIFRIIFGNECFIPEESKMVISAFAESMAWQIGSVISTS